MHYQDWNPSDYREQGKLPGNTWDGYITNAVHCADSLLNLILLTGC